MIRVIKFWSEYRVGKQPVDWVLLAPMGEDFERTQTPLRIDDIDPDKFPERKRSGDGYEFALARWKFIKPRYDAWKKGEELPEDGTPLAAWSGLTPDQVDILKSKDIRTVEEVAKSGVDVMAAMRFPNAQELPALAQAWLDGGTAAEKDAEIAAMKAQLATLTAAMNENSEPPKRGPGRPRKEAV